MEVLLSLPPLHVITEAKTRVGIYGCSAPTTRDPIPLTSVTPKSLGTWSTNPSYRCGPASYTDMYTTSCSWSRSLTSVNGKTDLTRTKNKTWSVVKMGPRPPKTLMLGCINRAQEGDTASVLENNLTLDIALWYYIKYIKPTIVNNLFKRCQKFTIVYDMLWPTSPSSGNTYGVQDTWKEINSTENNKKEIRSHFYKNSSNIQGYFIQ
jgi:hypothetical protein